MQAYCSHSMKALNDVLYVVRVCDGIDGITAELADDMLERNNNNLSFI